MRARALAVPDAPDIVVERSESLRTSTLPSGRRQHLPDQPWSTVRTVRAGERVAAGVQTLWLGSALVADAWTHALPTIGASEGEPSERDAALSTLVDRVLRAAERVGLACREVRSADLVITPAGEPSTSVDFTTGERMGLHIDNHQHLPLGRRADGFSVLGLSLGPGARWLHYVDRSVGELVEDAALDGPVDLRSARWLTDLTFSSARRPPVHRVQLPPGAAYLATTQDLVHDGSTAGAQQPDHALLIGGWFS